MDKNKKITPHIPKRSIHVVSLGCPKNQVDSEKLIAGLNSHRISDEPEKSDTIIINTCGFIDSAKEESVNAILEAVRLKALAAAEGKTLEIIVMGCLSQRYAGELKKEIPEIDRLYGVHETEQIIRDMGHAGKIIDRLGRSLLNPRHYAYLKISDGCNHRCGFCAIPGIRGRLKSAPARDLTEEARRLAAKGVKELILVSQDTTAYGFDLPVSGKKENMPLIRLLEKLHEIPGIGWIRLMYFYPTLISDSLLRAMASLPKICPYIDVPVQHISDPVLRAMRRGTTAKQVKTSLNRIRELLPGAAIRTSLIVGHPGETRKDFQELLAFTESFRFERLGVFPYSDEDGTHSYGLRPKCSKTAVQSRFGELMSVQQAISLELNRQRVGQRLKVLIDRKEDNAYFGRTAHDAPEIDHEVIIDGNEPVYAGRFADIYIDDAMEYDLSGRTSVKKK